jgi:hypothetical protein
MAGNDVGQVSGRSQNENGDPFLADLNNKSPPAGIPAVILCRTIWDFGWDFGAGGGSRSARHLLLAKRDCSPNILVDKAI